MPAVTSIERIVIVPRWSGHAGVDWYPWIREQLADESPRVEVVELPRPSAPVIDECVAALGSALGTDPAALRSTLLVGHSVGCQALMRYLASLRLGSSDRPDGPALLCVAGWWAVDNPWPTIEPWISTPISLASLRANTSRIVVLLSDNDPFTADWRANRLLWQERVGAQVEISSGGRHFNASQEPAVLELVRRLVVPAD
jgi:predicted alpha/beta hydrolase family esterase